MIRVCYDNQQQSFAPELTEDICKELDAITKKFKCDQKTFVHDVYLAIASKGKALMPRHEALAQTTGVCSTLNVTENNAERLILRQHKAISDLTEQPYFTAICDVEDKIDAAERIVSLFRTLTTKSQTAVCSSCPLMKDCSFGSNFLRSHSTFSGFVHPRCPAKPDSADLIEASIRAIMTLLLLTDEVQGAALEGQLEKQGLTKAALLVLAIRKAKANKQNLKEFDATFSGDRFLTELENAVNALTDKSLLVMQLADRFNKYILGEDYTKHKVNYVVHDQDVRSMSSMEDVPKAYPAQLVDDVFMDKKIALGELQVRQDLERKTKINQFEILLDISGSMRESILPNMYAFHTKASLASALALSVLKKVHQEKGILLFRFFCGDVDRLKIGKDQESYSDIARQIGLSDFNGGDTKINVALEAAAKDLLKVEGKKEILLITDSEDHLHISELKNILAKDVHLYVLDVGYGHKATGREALETVGTYTKVDPNNLNFETIAKVVQ